jgi:hypothetical protein
MYKHKPHADGIAGRANNSASGSNSPDAVTNLSSQRLSQLCRLSTLVFTLLSSAAFAAVPQALSPNGVAYYGMAVDTLHNADLAAYDTKLGGHKPAAYVVFLDFPFTAGQLAVVEPIILQIGQRKAAVIITLEPMAGLDAAASPAALADLSARVQRYEAQGASVIVRFAHEMNGGLTSCLQPAAPAGRCVLSAAATLQLVSYECTAVNCMSAWMDACRIMTCTAAAAAAVTCWEQSL